jgi:hypothetical protein
LITLYELLDDDFGTNVLCYVLSFGKTIEVSQDVTTSLSPAEQSLERRFTVFNGPLIAAPERPSNISMILGVDAKCI